jgi:hypothetical protein
MSEINANFVVNQVQTGIVVSQNEITFTPEPIQLRLQVGTNKIGTPDGPNTSVQFNDAGDLNGTANLTFNKNTNNLQIGNGTGGNLSGANVITANLFTGVLTTAAQPNVTSLGTLISLTYANNSSVDGISVSGGSNTGAHVSNFTNNLGGDTGVQFTIYGNSYASGSLFTVGANGSAMSANTNAPFGIGTRSAQPLVLGTGATEKVRVTPGGNVGVNTTIARGNISIGRDSTSSEESHILHFGYTPADFYGFRIRNTNNPALEASGNLFVQRGTVSSFADVITINNVGTVTIAAPASGNALTVSGATVSTSVITANITTGANTTPGTITGNWTLTAGSQLQATYADLAEYYVADAYYTSGTVVDFGGDKEVTLAEDNSRRVAGVVSTNPAYVMNSTCEGRYLVILALQGRVPCRVKGKIAKGDMLVSAGEGYARAESNPAVGTVIGKAIQNFDGTTGIIEVAVGRF